MKDPHQRLSWPELLSHPFVAGRVTGEYQQFPRWPGPFPPPAAWKLGALLLLLPWSLPPSSRLCPSTDPQLLPLDLLWVPWDSLGSQSQSLSLCPRGELLMKFSPCLPSD